MQLALVHNFEWVRDFDKKRENRRGRLWHAYLPNVKILVALSAESGQYGTLKLPEPPDFLEAMDTLFVSPQ